MDPEYESNTDSTRTLASIQVITSVIKHPHEEVKALEISTVLGWEILTRIGEVIPGQKVIYCEIDSLIPVTLEILPQAVKDRIRRNGVVDFFHVKTLNLFGKLSQGLIIPIPVDYDLLEIGANVTSLLGIQKFEQPIFSGKYKSPRKGGALFPCHILSKTDELRGQSHPWLLEELKGKPYYITVKNDGTSYTGIVDTEYKVFSRNYQRTPPLEGEVCPYWKVTRDHHLIDKLNSMPNIGIQGEICGPNIQKNLLKHKIPTLAIFNVWNLSEKRRLPLNEMRDICDLLEVPMVPIVDQGDNFNYTLAELLEMAKGVYPGTNNVREGLVIRSQDQTISFKIINNDYLLKYKI